jgi:hypothetical protein
MWTWLLAAADSDPTTGTGIDWPGWLALAVSIVGVATAVWFSRRSDRKATEALQIARAEQQTAERERRARPKLAIVIERMAPELGEDGVVRVGAGPGRRVLFRVGILNIGERDAHSIRDQVCTPVAVGGFDSQWTNAAGDNRPFDHISARRVARAGPTAHARLLDAVEDVLSQTLDGVARGVPLDLYLRIVVADPPPGVVDVYPVEVTATAEGTDPVSSTYVLRIGLAQ